MPRTIGPPQAAAISDHLLQFPPHNIAICFDSNDSEVERYANQIKAAIFQGGWNIDNCAELAPEFMKNLRDSPTGPLSYVDFWNFWNQTGGNPLPRIEGLRLDVYQSQRLMDEESKRNARPDPKNPGTSQIIMDALRLGGITNFSSGGGSLSNDAKPEETITLTVGPRPRGY
jgi:hypothetical protein